MVKYGTKFVSSSCFRSSVNERMAEAIPARSSKSSTPSVACSSSSSATLGSLRPGSLASSGGVAGPSKPYLRFAVTKLASVLDEADLKYRGAMATVLESETQCGLRISEQPGVKTRNIKTC